LRPAVAGVCTLTPGVLGPAKAAAFALPLYAARAGDMNAALRSCGTAISGLDVGESSQMGRACVLCLPLPLPGVVVASLSTFHLTGDTPRVAEGPPPLCGVAAMR
jgi:hypothetical protein